MKSKIYNCFALFYDYIYKGYHKRILSLLEDYFGSIKGENKTILDIGCGTGEFLLEMVKNGWRGVGIDASAEMIKIARGKILHDDTPCKFFVQNMESIKLHGQYNMITCNFDTINYILRKGKVLSLFKNVYQLLKPEGYFIFDIITPFQCKNFSGKFKYQFEKFHLNMIVVYNKDTRIKTIIMELSNNSVNCKEIHKQRCYEIEEIKDLLLKSRFNIKEIWDIESKKSKMVNLKTTRAFFIVQK